MTTDQRRVDRRETVMRMSALILLGTAVATMALAMACGGGDKKESTPSPEATAAPTATPTEAGGVEISDIAVDVASATITVDGDNLDWDSIEGATIPLKQIDLDELDPVQVQDLEIDFGTLPPVDATLKVATDEENVYVLLEVPDGFDYNPDPAMHNFSASIAVMFRIDDSAPAHMGVEEKDLDASLGVVDIWHWELDCGPGEMSGGGDTGDDPECNFDDEYAPNPGDREDDGGGDTPK